MSPPAPSSGCRRTDDLGTGSLSLITPLILVAAERRLNVREGWYVVASALSLSVTVSNWLAGIIAPWSTRPTRRTVQITANALAVVVVLWAAQKSLVPLSSFFVGRVEHSRFMFPLEAGGPGAIARALVFHSVVMPQVVVVPEPKWGTRMSVQRAALGSSGTIGTIATVLWSILLSVGVGALWIRRRTPQARALGLATVAQFAVYLCYGEETFLFAIQIAPLLVTCAAAATWTRHRRWVTALAMVLAVLLALQRISRRSRGRRASRAAIRFGPRPALMRALGAYAVWAALAVAALAIVRAQRRRPAAWQPPAIATVAAASVMAFAIVSWGRATPLGDFNKAYYPAGAMILSDPSRLYECDVSNLCFVNLPLVALLFTPLTMMARLPAQLLFTAIGAVAVAAAAWLTIRELDARGADRSAIVAAFALNGPLLLQHPPRQSDTRAAAVSGDCDRFAGGWT